MNRILKVKIILSVIVSSLLITYGAYNFATGDVETGRSFFIFGLTSTAGALIWILGAKYLFNRGRR